LSVSTNSPDSFVSLIQKIRELIRRFKEHHRLDATKHVRQLIKAMHCLLKNDSTKKERRLVKFEAVKFVEIVVPSGCPLRRELDCLSDITEKLSSIVKRMYMLRILEYEL